MLRSLRIVAQAAVVSMLPVIVAEAPARKAVSPSLVSSARSRRQTDVRLRIDVAEKGNGPQDVLLSQAGQMLKRGAGMGISALMGMESMPSSARLTAMSRRSSTSRPCR